MTESLRNYQRGPAWISGRELSEILPGTKGIDKPGRNEESEAVDQYHHVNPDGSLTNKGQDVLYNLHEIHGNTPTEIKQFIEREFCDWDNRSRNILLRKAIQQYAKK